MSTTGTDGIAWQGLGQVAVAVRDLEKQTAFYRDTLGLAFLFAIPTAAFQLGPVRLMLTKAEKPEFDHPASILYYKVEVPGMRVRCVPKGDRRATLGSREVRACRNLLSTRFPPQPWQISVDATECRSSRCSARRKPTDFGLRAISIYSSPSSRRSGQDF